MKMTKKEINRLYRKAKKSLEDFPKGVSYAQAQNDYNAYMDAVELYHKERGSEWKPTR